jgi:type II secretory pathway pseudopilin PulG
MNARGFTLLEVMIACGMLIVGLSGVLSAMTTYEHVRRKQGQLGQGLFVAESSLERALHEAPVDGCVTVDGDMNPREPDGTDAVFTVCRTFTAIGSLPGSRTLEVIVTWGSRDRLRLVSVHTS